MNVRAFLLGLSVGIVVSSFPSCGTTTKRCLRSNCAGCCDENDECKSGTAAIACGSDGRTCSACTSGMSCDAGVCVSGNGGGSSGTGGGNTGTGGGSAGGTAACANCDGCCDNGTCKPGNAIGACGVGGAACQNCQSQNKACSAMGQCVGITCVGCTTEAGGCAPGNSDVACGSDAGVCVRCASGQSCLGGACRPSCGPLNCGGCCDGTSCVQTPSAAKCGNGGVVCVTCGGGMVCASGSCMGGAGGGAGGAGGGGSGGGTSGGGSGGGTSGGGSGGGLAVCQLTCFRGCCDATGQCKPGDARSECGSLGGTCQACTGALGCVPNFITGGGICG
jgi:hypothetical protein